MTNILANKYTLRQIYSYLSTYTNTKLKSTHVQTHTHTFMCIKDASYNNLYQAYIYPTFEQNHNELHRDIHKHNTHTCTHKHPQTHTQLHTNTPHTLILISS